MLHSLILCLLFLSLWGFDCLPQLCDSVFQSLALSLVFLQCRKGVSKNMGQVVHSFMAHAAMQLFIKNSWVLFPNCVKKHSQLSLILHFYMFHDAPHFQCNVCVESTTFDALDSLIEDHEIFQNNPQNQQFVHHRLNVRKLYWKNWELKLDHSTIELFSHINPTTFILLLQGKANLGI